MKAGERLPIRLVVGLGNPGSQYANTRHNLGYMALDRLSRLWGIRFRVSRWGWLAGGGRQTGLLKPKTFMNLSGEAVGAYARWHRLHPSQILVLVDDLDLPVGKVRVRAGGSAGGHNGLKSLIEVFHSESFPRVRIGIGRPPENIPVVDFVLSPFRPEEKEAIQTALDCAVKAADVAVAQGVAAAMDRVNGC